MSAFSSISAVSRIRPGDLFVNRVPEHIGELQQCWGGEKNPPVYLGSPLLRYASSQSQEVQKPEFADRPWERRSENLWVYSDGTIELTVCRSDRGNGSPWRQSILSVTATALQKVRVGVCSIDLYSPSPRAPRFINRHFQWRELSRHDALNDLGSLCVRWGAHEAVQNELRSKGQGIAAELRWEHGEFRIRVMLDAAALHPRWRFLPNGNISAAAPEWNAGQSIQVELFLSSSEAADELPAIISRYPRGAEAGFVLTDHCDYDTEARIRSFLHGGEDTRGWLGRGLKITKGVFSLSSTPPDRPPAASLEDPQYRTLVRELYEDGSEIAPHALNESNNIHPRAFQMALDRFAREWNPATWIDHGSSFDYLYAMGGGEHPDYMLLRELKAKGFSALWSYQDTPTNACRTLNLIAPAVSDLGPMASFMVRHFLRGEFLVGMHYLRSIVHRYLSHPRWIVLKVMMATFRNILLKWQRTKRVKLVDIRTSLSAVYRSFVRTWVKKEAPSDEPYTLHELMHLAAALYPERGVPLHQCTPDDMMLFTTNEITHTSDAYTKAQLESLIEERGLHIGHSYILNQLPYIAGIFQPGTTPPRLRWEWTSFLDLLEAAVRSGKLWNPTARDLVNWVRNIQSVRCTPVGPHSMEIENASGQPVSDLTLLLPRTIDPGLVKWSGGTPCGSRSWGDWQAVWGDLPPHGRTVVQWV